MPLLTELRVEKVPGTKQEYVLTAPLMYQWHTETWYVPMGFRTDLASIPRAVQWLLPHDGPYAAAAVVHDWLYIHRPNGMDRASADGVMLRIMKELRVSWWKRGIIYAAIRVGGWWYWYRGCR